MTDWGFIICLCFSTTDGHLGCFQFGTIMIKALGAFICQKKFQLIWYLSIMIKGFINISHIVLLFQCKMSTNDIWVENKEKILGRTSVIALLDLPLVSCVTLHKSNDLSWQKAFVFCFVLQLCGVSLYWLFGKIRHWIIESLKRVEC